MIPDVKRRIASRSGIFYFLSFFISPKNIFVEFALVIRIGPTAVESPLPRLPRRFLFTIILDRGDSWAAMGWAFSRVLANFAGTSSSLV
jgi:hypothetical protein